MKATEIPDEQFAFERGEKVQVEKEDGRWLQAEFVGSNAVGVGVLAADQYRFFPWTSVRSLLKAVE